MTSVKIILSSALENEHTADLSLQVSSMSHYFFLSGTNRCSMMPWLNTHFQPGPWRKVATVLKIAASSRADGGMMWFTWSHYTAESPGTWPVRRFRTWCFESLPSRQFQTGRMKLTESAQGFSWRSSGEPLSARGTICCASVTHGMWSKNVIFVSLHHFKLNSAGINFSRPWIKPRVTQHLSLLVVQISF